MDDLIEGLRARVASIAGVIASAVALISGLKQALLDAIDADDMDAVREITMQLEAHEAELASAVAAGTIAEGDDEDESGDDDGGDDSGEPTDPVDPAPVDDSLDGAGTQTVG